MKRIIPALLMVSVLFACNKSTSTDDGSTPNEPKYPVSFSISDFLVETNNMRVAADSSLSKITDIYYFAYGSDGVLRDTIHQDTARNKTNFGVINDSLAAGTYTIVINAGTGPIAVNGGANLSSAGLGGRIDANDDMEPIPDIFFKKLQVTINGSGNPTFQNVTLDRITGRIRVECYDALPASNAYGEVRLGLSTVPTVFSFSTASVNTGIPMNFKDNLGVRIDQTTLEANVLGSTRTFWAHVMYKDKTTGTSKTKSFPDLLLPANKKTTIKGYLYGAPDPNQGDYQVKVNSWFSDSATINF